MEDIRFQYIVFCGCVSVHSGVFVCVFLDVRVCEVCMCVSVNVCPYFCMCVCFVTNCSLECECVKEIMCKYRILNIRQVCNCIYILPLGKNPSPSPFHLTVILLSISVFHIRVFDTST